MRGLQFIPPALILVLGICACRPAQPGPGEAGLSLVAVTPADGAVDVPRDGLVQATFSHPLDAASVNETSVILFPSEGGDAATLAGTRQTDGRRVSFTPTAPLAADTAYTLRLLGKESGLRGLEGELLEATLTMSFRSAGGGTGDTTPPRVLSFEPADGAEGVPLDATLRVRFDEAIDCGTVTAIEVVEWWDGNPQGAPLALGRSCGEADTLVELRPDAHLGLGDQYRISVGTGLTDTAGNALAAEASSIFDAAWVSPENTPRVVDTWPADGASAVPTSASVQIRFSKRMRQSTVDAPSVTLTPAGGSPVQLARETFLNPVFVLRPVVPLAANTPHVLRIFGVEDEGQNPMSDEVVVRFVTGSGPAPALEVLSVTPADQASGVDHTGRVSVSFNQPIDPSSVYLSYTGTTGTFRVSRYSDLAFPEEGSLDFSQLLSVHFDIDPATTYELEHVYHLGVSGGTQGARSLAGGALAADFRSSFTTQGPDLPDGTLADVRAASGSCAIRVPNVFMTFFRDQPSNWKGFFVQDASDGPAVFVVTGNRQPLFPVYPWGLATGYPNIDLTVTRVDEYEGFKQVTAFSMTRNDAATEDLAWVKDNLVQVIGDEALGVEHESEYLQVDGTLTNYRPGGSAENREFDLVWGSGQQVTVKVSQFGILEPMSLAAGQRVRVLAPLQRDAKGWFLKPYGYWDELEHTQAELADPANYDLMLDIVKLAD